MPKLGMEPIRRKQLIEATIASIHRHGYADTTVASISREAGVSGGIIHHYFDDKDALLAATMRSLLVELRSEVASSLAGLTEPKARIEAVIDANFADRQFQAQVVTAWLAFWAQSPHATLLARLQRINERRLRSTLRYDLRKLVGDVRSGEVALSLAAMIDGLWLRCALADGGIAPATARHLARDHLSRQLIAVPAHG